MHLKLKGKILSGFLIVCLFIVIGGTVAVTMINSQQAGNQKLVNTYLTQIADTGKIMYHLAGVQKSFETSRQTGNEADFDTAIEQVDQSIASVNDIFSHVIVQNDEGELDVDSVTSATIKNYYTELTQYLNDLKDAIEGMKTGSTDMKAIEEASMKIMQQIGELEQTIYNVIDNQINTLDNLANIGRIIIIATTIICLILSLIIGLNRARAIVKPINEVNAILEEIANGKGDLSKRINVKSKDEIGELANHFNGFISKINELIKSIQKTADMLSDSSVHVLTMIENANGGSREITHNIESLSLSSESNAASVEEANAGIEEMAGSSEVISNESDDVSNNSNNVLNYVQNGVSELNGIVMENQELQNTTETAFETIQSLKNASGEIEEIVTIINSISEQTNLLALNAAIEAARAGENGRGFAVVAEEIRGLAEESKNSTEKIKSLISDIISKSNNAAEAIQKGHSNVDVIVDKTNEVSQHFDNILELMESNNEKIYNVTDSSRNQAKISLDLSQGLNEITLNIQETTDVIAHMQNALNDQVQSFNDVEEKMVALKSVAAQLKEQTGEFKTI
ncbi:methyl-accepting chemotaxis protein [Vallitalea okinawensis]|uniref:methyl-accepting chemotaxis protein n=1 Tax=Vallitalea okinawensis TaxID=2078660 RepID=UPI000CFE141C|nr:methyl-accepting chemotaxis protein [Vallitalea okinawensis]